ncbi:MAG: ABC transporter ATP-binding protein [Lachnospiraceae bacterium]|nr:ABC transporter ATP-binding protein [Lachnospiraceae bacterium]
MKLRTENVSFSYDKNEKADLLFDKVNISLESGQIMAILGPNGSGKTTFLRCLMGMLKWTGGKSFFDERDTNTLSFKEFWEKVSYVPQQRMAATGYTAFENVLLGRSGQVSFFGVPKKTDLEAAENIMEELGISALKNRTCSSLSGGEFQMVLIAKALVSNPKLLILDEPESGLDFRNQLIVLNTFDKLKKKGISCIFNTHYPKHALQKADCSLLLGGRLPVFGRTGDVVNEENIENFFGVKAIINEMQVDGEVIKNIVPIYVTRK